MITGELQVGTSKPDRHLNHGGRAGDCSTKDEGGDILHQACGTSLLLHPRDREEGRITIHYVPTEDNLADSGTKHLN